MHTPATTYRVGTLLSALFEGKSTTKTANKKKKTLINYNSLRFVVYNIIRC